MLTANPYAPQFQVVELFTIDGDGYATVRRPRKCQKWSDPDQTAAYMGIGWHAEVINYKSWSYQSVERHYRTLFTVSVDVRLCSCGCLD